MCATQKRRAFQRGFTLVELMVVVAMIAILASLLLPALSSAKGQGQKARCITDFKQLHLAWFLYTDDNNRFPYNSDPNTNAPGWVTGSMLGLDDWPENTNTVCLLNSQGGIGPYLNEARVFRCPADRSMARINSVLYPRVRSVAMNMFIGGAPDGATYSNYADLSRLPPLDTGFVFIDTHADSITVPHFITHPWDYRLLMNSPASRHNGGAVLSFSGGHVVFHKWLDPRTRKPETGHGHLFFPEEQRGSKDIQWLYPRALNVGDPKQIQY